MTRLACFKAYDVRGRLGVDLDAGLMRRIGRAYAQVIRPGRVAVGRDARASSPELLAALVEGLTDEGAEVLDLGLCGTEEVYFAAFHLRPQGVGGGLMVTASHNPADWNGLKLVREDARPIAWDTGLSAIHDLVAAGGPDAPQGGSRGQARPAGAEMRPLYARHVASFVRIAALRPLHVLANAGNGAAGPTFDAVAAALNPLPFEVTRLDWEPDPAFPNGIPNPLLPENRERTAQAVREAGADLGLAWDGDFDRCFFFDEAGAFVDGEHVVALLATATLAKEPGAAIVHEPRVVWATLDAIARGGGRAVASRTGHAHLKASLREHDAPYGGEMSAHHYFRDFGYCDSGMIPALLVAELVARGDRPLSALVGALRQGFPSSGEINFAGLDHAAALARFEATYGPQARAVDRLDGLSLDFGAWRANLRTSNTEGLLRLNLETRGDRDLLGEKVAELRAFLAG